MRALNEIFNDRTCYKFTDKPVKEELLVKIYDLMKLGPTSANCCPLRITFIQTTEQKEKLLTCAMEGNIDKIKSAPVIALFAYDEKFYDKLEIVNPVQLYMRDYFISSEETAYDSALRNSTLQAAYFMIIARGEGLDLGPMSGFDGQKLNEMFFKGTDYKVNFICNMGYRDGSNPFPRLPRFSFSEVCKIL